MYRFRHVLITVAMVAAFSAIASSAYAQPGGGGGGGGRGGRGGFGGFGGFGGGPGGFGGGPGGRGGGSVLSLALNAAVGEEIKLKEPQKVKLQALQETVNQRRQQLREQMFPQRQRGQNNQGGGRNRNNANAQNGGGGGQGGGGQGGGGGFGGGGQGGGGGFGGGGQGGGGGFGGGGQGGGGGFGGGGQGGGGGQFRGGRGRGQMDPEMAARFEQSQQAMATLDQDTDKAVARILDRGQFSRVKQIQLQLQGHRVLLQPDMIEKLTLGEDQVVELRQLLNQSNQAEGETRRARMEMMREGLPSLFANNGQNGGGQNAGAQNGGGQNAGAQNGGGQNGGRGGGRGGRGGPNFRDPAVQEAMQKFMEQPDVKAKMEQFQAQTTKIQNQLTAAVFRVLGRRAATAYKKMLGAPFDLTKIRGGPGNSNGNTNQTNASETTTKAQASENEDEEAAPAKPAPAAKAKSTPTPAKAKRKSLRELRGLGDE
jgi:hypothetical protein